MKTIRFFVLVTALLGLAACGAPSKFKTYNGPEVTRIIINKGDREMFLMHHNRVLKSHEVDLGFAPEGHKEFEGDGKTPEGDYSVDRRNPNSSFHLSLGISYPNEQDIAYAEVAGKSPGGDIFIHGEPNKLGVFGPDWTAGCISVTNGEIENIYAMVRDGTPVTINP
ncbi:L,D-transpeptidase catalytic domain [Roseovarius marisflavi]|uniref:L,D-transpeptidase catalytic domain n=1 Tax=Roseovarius marisflavi TaxID=1054996 RepID=A0A1M6XYG2_9RHOB|nr:L,D-transpeptidase family protein [Roseovarius marisflavi]SHL10946.1 L,D-transpeptidase catalytic domain [Roseovarius marisflavi]